MPPRILLVGAAPDTGNLGVSALCYSVVTEVTRRAGDTAFCVFDHGFGDRDWALATELGPVQLTRTGASGTRRIYRPESYYRMCLASRLRSYSDRSLSSWVSCDAVLDVSGGDSFTELYGARRFRNVAMPKQLAMSHGKPLVLLPQTYGPFKTAKAKELAAKIVRGSAQAWARDQRSFAVLQELAGAEFESNKYREGVDVAFLLEIRPPESEHLESFGAWCKDNAAPIVGLNVSGLLWNDPVRARERFQLACDYRQVVLKLARRILDESNAQLLLVPHVLTQHGHFESDGDACEAVFHELEDRSRGRTFIAPIRNDPREAKWFISQCDWFCGTRMHSTIAALSSGIPTAAIAYSDKTLGVFETCGQGLNVADPRKLSTEEVIEQVWSSWRGRNQSRASLAVHLPGVLRKAEEQMDVITELCTSCANPSGGMRR